MQEAVNMPTVGRPVVVALCTDGSRSCMVRPSVIAPCITSAMLSQHTYRASHVSVI